MHSRTPLPAAAVTFSTSSAACASTRASASTTLPPPLRYEFDEGAPPEPCRPYTDEEWGRLLVTVLRKPAGAEAGSAVRGAVSGSAPEAAKATPVAIFLSGLPGGGKSCSLATLFDQQPEQRGEPQGSRSTQLEEKQLQPEHSLRSRLRLPPLHSCAVVDFDELRLCHDQYAAACNRRSTAAGARESRESTSIRRSYRDLVPWFMSGTAFEDVMFRPVPGRGLLPTIMVQRRSFVMEAVLDSHGCFSFVQHVAAAGYRIVLVHVHTPLDVAVARAEQRAYRTGRWSSPDFIGSRRKGLQEWLLPMARVVLHETQDGVVALFDNSADGVPPSLVYPPPAAAVEDELTAARAPVDDTAAGSDSGAILRHYRLDQLFASKPEPSATVSAAAHATSSVTPLLLPPPVDMLHCSRRVREKHISGYALQLLRCVLPPAAGTPLPEGWSTSVCIAGGFFKTLLTGRAPRDVDVFACSAEDRERFSSLLQMHADGHCQLVKDSLFQTQWSVQICSGAHSSGSSSSPPSTLLVELARRYDPPELAAKLARFDLALSAVGVCVRVERRSAKAVNADSGITPSAASSHVRADSSQWHLTVSDVFVHPDWCRSLERRTPLLLRPLPNPHFLLATAERTVRYATEMGWPEPMEQLDYLRGQWRSMCDCPLSSFPAASVASSQQHASSPFRTTREWLLHNYRHTTHGGEAQQIVRRWFELGSQL